MPAYCISMGCVLLLALPKDEARGLLEASPRTQRMERTMTDISALMAEIEATRACGCASIDQEVGWDRDPSRCLCRTLAGRLPHA